MTQGNQYAPVGELPTEATEAGEQMLTAGVRPITTRDRLTLMALRPMAPRRNPNANQKPCDHGLFDGEAEEENMERTHVFPSNEKNQIDLIDFLKSNPFTPTKT